MKKIQSYILALILTFALLCSHVALAVTEQETDFGVIYLVDGTDQIDYTRTRCDIGLQYFVAEKSADYDEFMDEHLSSPDLSSNLLEPAIEKYDTYRSLLLNELYNYNARLGTTTSAAFEELEKCNAFITNHVDERKEHFKVTMKAGASDRATIRYKERLNVINERFKDVIHFPFAQFMGRMKSFADNLPCFTNKCAN